MAQVEPFAAIRYDFAALSRDVSSHIAPPYDVLNQQEKDELLATSPHNIVAIDLPHLPPKSAGPPEVYARAAETMNAWMREGVLIREAQPAIYVYHQTFSTGGETYTRRKLIVRVRATPFSEGVVLPHEETFGGPKEDRLALMKATRCNLSPVFALFSDPTDAVGAAIAPVTSRPPDATGTLEGVENRLWIATDASVIDPVRSALAPKKVFIADGHHRYGTALNYAAFIAGEKGVGKLPPEDPAGFVMMVLASMDDSGCLILPYPRVLASIALDAVLAAWRPGVEQVAPTDADLTLYEGATGRSVGVRFTNRAALDRLAPDKSAAWRSLDLAYIHRYLVENLLASSSDGVPAIRYMKSIERAKAAARDEGGVALLVKATSMDQLRGVSEAGELMPQKSTYFYPKLATGLAINPLE
jgi:uncharacterized protein (DUF1015 family)